jgi:hypothetical protein
MKGRFFSGTNTKSEAKKVEKINRLGNMGREN